MTTILRRPLPWLLHFDSVSGSKHSLLPLSGTPTLSALGAQLRNCAEKHTFQNQSYGNSQHPSATDYELSLGRIVDTLTADNRAVFEWNPDFDIYDNRVVFELGLGGDSDERRTPTLLKGKEAYRRALPALQRLATSTLRNGTVKCSMHHGSPYGGSLRVNWTCTGL